MQKKIVSLSIGLMVLVLISCNPKGDGKSDRPVLSKNIEYDVTINNFKMISAMGISESGYSWFRNNIEASSRGAFLELLFKNAKAGKLELYDLNDKRIDTNKLKVLLLAKRDTIKAQRLNPPYSLYDTVVDKVIQPEEITALRFREEWTYDPKTMAISKKVLAYAPVWTPITFDKDQNEVYGQSKALFWVKWSKDPTMAEVLTKRIMYTTAYKGSGVDQRDEAKNVDSVAIQKYMDLLLDRAFKDSITAYEITGGSLADVSIKGKNLYKNLTDTRTLTQQRTTPPYSKYDTVITMKPNANAIRFNEQWTFDPFTMAIEKKVVGVCPVERCYEDDGITFKGYRLYFWVYFTDVWMPITGRLELKKSK